MRRNSLYGYETPFLKPMIEAVAEGNKEQAVRWSFKEVERPIRRLKRKFPDYTTPRDCKRRGELYLEDRVPLSQVSSVVSELYGEAKLLDGADKALALSVGEGISSLRTKSHVMGYVFFYLTALKMNGASDREIEKEAERMRLSYALSLT